MGMARHCRSFRYRADKDVHQSITLFLVLMPLVFRNRADQLALAVITFRRMCMKDKIRVAADRKADSVAVLILFIAGVCVLVNCLKNRICLQTGQICRFQCCIALSCMHMLCESAYWLF